MYNLTIHFGPNAVAWSFLFKDEKKAHSIFNNVIEAMKKDGELGGIITDEFGQACYLLGGAISGVLLEDLDSSEEARIVRGLTQAKGQLRANKRAQNDPEIKALQREQQAGPGVITPFTNGGFRHQ